MAYCTFLYFSFIFVVRWHKTKKNDRIEKTIHQSIYTIIGIKL